MSPSPYAPELRRLAPFLPRGAVGPRRLGLMRRLQGPLARKVPDGVTVETHGDQSYRIHRPAGVADGPRPAVLWIHGGGYVMGSPAQDDEMCRLIASRLGVLVVAASYRVAPEHPFPTPLHDCHDALVWLADRPDVDADRIAIAGASAGGGLAAALALLAHERGEVTPVFQLLVYPMLDDRAAARGDVDDRHARLWNNASNRFGWECYLGQPPGGPDVPGLAAPARYEDLSGLPPAWIGVGSLDVFHEEDLAYAERLRAAGVDCTVEVVTGAFHGFDSIRPKTEITRRWRESQLEALASALL